MLFKNKKKTTAGNNGSALPPTNPQDASLIASGTNVKGDFNGRGNLRIAGRLEGQVENDGQIWVDKTGEVIGKVRAREIVIEDHIKGDIESTEKTDLRSGARVIGDIRCGKITVAEDSFFQGEIQMQNA